MRNRSVSKSMFAPLPARMARPFRAVFFRGKSALMQAPWVGKSCWSSPARISLFRRCCGFSLALASGLSAAISGDENANKQARATVRFRARNTRGKDITTRIEFFSFATFADLIMCAQAVRLEAVISGFGTQKLILWGVGPVWIRLN